MPQRVAYETTMPEDERRRRQVERTAKNACRNDLRPKNKEFKPSRDGRHDAKYQADMQWIRGNCPLIHVPGPDTRGYDEDIRVVMALDRSLAKALKPDEVRAILGAMLNETFNGRLKWPLDHRRANDFLERRFDQEGRRRLYILLNNSLSIEYGGRGKKIRLSEALKSFRNYCRLMRVWFAPSCRPQEEFPPDLDDYHTQYKQALSLMPSNMDRKMEGQLAWAVRGLRHRYVNELLDQRPPGYIGGLHYGRWPVFFKELVEYFDRQDTDIWPGWFKPDSIPVKNFLADAGFRGTKVVCRQPAYNKEQKGSRAQW